MTEVGTFILIALLAESVWETLKMIWQEGKVDVDKIGVIVLAVAICVGTGADLFAMLELPLPGMLGAVLTGVLCSRGANFLHDIFNRVEED